MTYLLLFVIWVALVACVLALVAGGAKPRTCRGDCQGCDGSCGERDA